MTYQLSYYKYVNKHNNLLQQNGGFLPFFVKGIKNIAVNIYAIDKGVCYFGFVRKLHKDGRYENMYGLTGSAGTKSQYWGKWVTIGGNGNKKRQPYNYMNYLKLIIQELNDETNSGSFFKSENVDLGYISGKLGGYSNNYNLICRHVYEDVNNVIFLFEMIDTKSFFSIFPKSGRASKNTNDIYSSSGKELDAIQSLNMENIICMQELELKERNVNYFTSYVISSLNRLKDIMPQNFKNKWNNIKINKKDDDEINGRIPVELLHDKFI